MVSIYNLNVDNTPDSHNIRKNVDWEGESWGNNPGSHNIRKNVDWEGDILSQNVYNTPGPITLEKM